MKECRYCGSFYEDSLSSCPNCGGSKIVTAEEKAAEEKLYIKEIQNQENSVFVPADEKKNKSRTVLVLGILAIAAVIGIVIFGGQRTSSLGNTRAESNAAYEAGLSYYNNGDYENAIMQLSEVAESSKYYKEAQEMLATATTNYRTDILAKVNAYVEKQEYEVAIALLEQVLMKLPIDAELQSAYEDIIASYTALICSTAIAEADAFVAEGNFESAIYVINDALSQVGVDEELSAKLEVYTQSYKAALYDDARNAYLNEDYLAAVAILQTSTAIIGSDTEILDLIEQYNQCAPIPVNTLNCIYEPKTSDSFYKWMIIDEMMAEDYVTYYNLLQAWYSWDDPLVTYAVEKEYVTLSGTLVFNGAQSTAAATPILNVYGDGELIASIQVNKNTRSVPFSVDISDVNYLGIECIGFSSNSTSYAAISEFCVFMNSME